MNPTKRPELLLPAKNPEIAKAAFAFGADAVYIGGEAFSLRAKADNFSPEAMQKTVDLANTLGKKIYVTANIFAKNEDLDEAAAYFSTLRKIRPHGILIADPGLFSLAKKICPDIPLHVSTQANTTNYEAFRFWKALGAARVVAARELTLAQIRSIREKTPDGPEIEVFVHGAMCMAYSGRCLLSAYFTGKEANHGVCTHPCRWKYAVAEETRPGEYLPVEENARGTFIFHSRDLCMIAHIPELLVAGVHALKIEGRMKNALYVACTARAYGTALREYCRDPALYRRHLPLYIRQLRTAANRPWTTGFFSGAADKDAQIYREEENADAGVYLGTVLEEGERGQGRLLQYNKFDRGDRIFIMRPNRQDTSTRITAICGADGTVKESAPHPRETLWVAAEEPLLTGDILYKKRGVLQ